jgi:hypothetical protein
MSPVRLPVDGDPVPHMGRMIAMSAWAAIVVLLGMVVAVRTFVAIVLQPGPAWVVPTVTTIGIAGTLCAGFAFAAIHHKTLPWRLLGAASGLLLVNLALVATAF